MSSSSKKKGNKKKNNANKSRANTSNAASTKQTQPAPNAEDLETRDDGAEIAPVEKVSKELETLGLVCPAHLNWLLSFVHFRMSLTSAPFTNPAAGPYRIPPALRRNKIRDQISRAQNRAAQTQTTSNSRKNHKQRAPQTPTTTAPLAPPPPPTAMPAQTDTHKPGPHQEGLQQQRAIRR